MYVFPLSMLTIIQSNINHMVDVYLEAVIDRGLPLRALIIFGVMAGDVPRKRVFWEIFP